VGTVQDISAVRQLEEEGRARRDEMEFLVKQQVVAQTGAAIAHELNQPLVAISAYAEAALSMLQSGDVSSDRLVRALKGSVEQAQRAGRTLRELLQSLTKGEFAAEPVDLNEAIREAIGAAVGEGYGGFQPILDLDDALPQVFINPSHLQKVLYNLLHNSVHAMRDAGVPSGEIAICVRSSVDGTLAQVTVQDSGPGVDPETARRVFEPFFTTKPKGIGLGLAISRSLVEAHGGQLWIDHPDGPGATFHFTVPFAG
jgi:signal transduction histidine kinase